MRGNGWGQDHSTVNYVWSHSPQLLTRYHNEVMAIGYEQHDINFNDKWTQGTYRGKNCDDWGHLEHGASHFEKVKLNTRDTIYPEHDYDYLVECIENLEGKDVDMSMAREELLDK